MYNRLYYKVLRRSRINGNLYSAAVPLAKGGIRYHENRDTVAPKPTQLLVFEKLHNATAFAQYQRYTTADSYEVWSVKVPQRPNIIHTLVSYLHWGKETFQRYWTGAFHPWSKVPEGTWGTPRLRLHRRRM